MCGIAGFLTNKPECDLPAVLAGFRRDLAHRGPDGAGAQVIDLPHGRRLGLAQTRLAILDLSDAGRQPMHDPETGVWVAFNGEIYNHQDLRTMLPPREYASTGDTATLLNLWAHWGPAGVQALRGMFAFALFDPRKQELWLARDPWGIKPLYVAHSNEGLAFASEVRTLLAAGVGSRRLDPQALESYLTFGSVPAPWTFVEGIQALLPGEVRRYSLSGERYSLPTSQFFGVEPFPHEVDAEGSLKYILEVACGRNMLSDVPVGVFLSGGIDSGVVAATLVHRGFDLQTFSIVMAEKEFDESPYSRQIAKHLGTTHHEIMLTPEEILRDVPTAVEAYDHPSFDGVNTYFVSRATRQAGVKVALSGLGGDEFFAGYPYFRWVARRARTPGFALHALAGVLQTVRRNSVAAAKLAELAQAKDAIERYVACRTLMPSATRRRLLAGPAMEVLPTLTVERLRKHVTGCDAVTAQSWCDASLYMADMLLRDGDQMAMAHALEVRFPLLDLELTLAALAIPGKRKLAPGKRGPLKGLLLDACPIELPPAAVNRKKMGFVLPYARWLRGPLASWAADVLHDDKLWTSLAFRPAAVRELWQGFGQNSPSVRSSDVLALVHLGCWARSHGLTAV